MSSIINVAHDAKQKRLTMDIAICNMYIAICDKYAPRRKAQISPGSGRQSARPRSRDDAAGDHTRGEERTGENHQPVISVADRKWRASAFDEHYTYAAGEVFQSPSRIPGGRPRGLQHGV